MWKTKKFTCPETEIIDNVVGSRRRREIQYVLATISVMGVYQEGSVMAPIGRRVYY